MGGKGSGRPPSIKTLINNTKPKQETRTPIATEIYIPNLSGDHSKGRVRTTPTQDLDIPNKKYVDDQIAGIDDHNELGNLNWADAGHTIDTGIDMNGNSITEINKLRSNVDNDMYIDLSYQADEIVMHPGQEAADRIIIFKSTTNTDASPVIKPSTDNSGTLGETTDRWKMLYANDINLDNPSDVYNLSHDSFADYSANEHIDWTNASDSINISSADIIVNTGEIKATTDDGCEGILGENDDSGEYGLHGVGVGSGNVACYLEHTDGTQFALKTQQGKVDFQGITTIGNYEFSVDSSTLVANKASYTDKVGIGKSTPAEKLHILDGSANIVIGSPYGGSWAGIAFASSFSGNNYSLLGDSSDTMLNAPSGGTIYLRVNNGTKGQVDTSGIRCTNTNFISSDGTAGLTQSENGVTNFDIVIKNGLITSFTKN